TQWPGCFETIDAGNPFELRDKIVGFDREKLETLKQLSAGRSLDDLTGVYQGIFDGMVSREHSPTERALPKEEPLYAGMSPNASSPEKLLLDELAHARTAFVEAVAVQELLKTEKVAAE